MNENKIDLILKGINLLIMTNENICDDTKKDFNLEFFDIFNPKEKEQTSEEKQQGLTKDAFCEYLE